MLFLYVCFVLFVLLFCCRWRLIEEHSYSRERERGSLSLFSLASIHPSIRASVRPSVPTIECKGTSERAIVVSGWRAQQKAIRNYTPLVFFFFSIHTHTQTHIYTYTTVVMVLVVAAAEAEALLLLLLLLLFIRSLFISPTAAHSALWRRRRRRRDQGAGTCSSSPAVPGSFSFVEANSRVGEGQEEEEEEGLDCLLNWIGPLCRYCPLLPSLFSSHSFFFTVPGKMGLMRIYTHTAARTAARQQQQPPTGESCVLLNICALCSFVFCLVLLLLLLLLFQ